MAAVASTTEDPAPALRELDGVIRSATLGSQSLAGVTFDERAGAWWREVVLSDSDGRTSEHRLVLQRLTADHDGSAFLVAALNLHVGRVSELAREVVLEGINELNADVGVKFRLDAADSDDGAITCEGELTEDRVGPDALGQLVQSLADAMIVHREEIGRLVESGREMAEDGAGSETQPALPVGTAASSQPATVQEAGVGQGHDPGAYSVVAWIALVAFALTAYLSLRHPPVETTVGPASPARATAAIPGPIIAGAKHAGLTGRLVGASDPAAPGGPIWVVYSMVGSRITSARALDATTTQTVYLYSRVKDSGAYPYLSYLHASRTLWTSVGIAVALILAGVRRWARLSWERAVLCVDGPLSARVVARARRLVYEVAWLAVLAGIGALGWYTNLTRAPGFLSLTLVSGGAVLLAWLVASFAVIHSGAIEAMDTGEAA